MNAPDKPQKRRANSAIFKSTRIRLARNLAGRKFVNTLDPNGLSEVLNFCEQTLSGVRKLSGGTFLKMDDLPQHDKDMLVEDRLASRELAESAYGRGVFVSADRKSVV